MIIFNIKLMGTGTFKFHPSKNKYIINKLMGTGTFKFHPSKNKYIINMFQDTTYAYIKSHFKKAHSKFLYSCFFFSRIEETTDTLINPLYIFYWLEYKLSKSAKEHFYLSLFKNVIISKNTPNN